MSTAQDIYISPKQIISYLMEFEKRLPKPHRDYYIAKINATPVTEADLNNEAKRMMDFLGLTMYKPKCSFAKLEDGVGGNTMCCNNNPEVEINVSIKYQNNLNACLAVLAHEVCHKYLFVNRIYYPTDIINEIYTDLCTMYVGFGNLIKNGYITEQTTKEQTEKYITTYTNTQYLGYLNFPIYERTLSIIRMVLWNEDGKKLYESEQDPMLQDAFRLWSTTKDKKALSKQSFIKLGENIATLERNFYLLRRLADLITKRFNTSVMDEAERTLYNDEWFDGDSVAANKSFTVFNGIYQSIILAAKADDHGTLKDINRLMSHVLVTVSDKENLRGPLILKPTDFTCPHCGKHHFSDKFAGRKILIKCPDCHRRFLVNCENVDLQAARNDLDHYKDELILPVRKGYFASLDREKQNSYKKGYAEGVSAKEKELKQKFKNKISKLPFWLRWLIGKRLD